MRLRNKPWAKPLITAHPELISVHPTDLRGKWATRFEKDQPIMLEVGSGKGQFIIEMAKAHPDQNFIGLEIQESAVAVILRKQVALLLPNLQLVLGDGADLTDYFADSEIAGLFLNFSDPWPKTRHEKRRLTYRSFLQQYQAITRPNAPIQLKTDNQGLFEYSLQSLNAYGMQFDRVSLDLHHSAWQADNIETEYEEKFSRQGGRIYALLAHFSSVGETELSSDVS